MTKSKKLHIIGIERSGTTSLEVFYMSQGYTVKRDEFAYCFEDAVQLHKEYYPDYIAVMAVRDPIMRCFSDYWYSKRTNQIPSTISYKEALERYPRFAHGSCTAKWIKKWSEVPLVIVDFDDITRTKGYPKYKVNSIRPDMTDDDIHITAKAIKEAENTEYCRKFNDTIKKIYLDHDHKHSLVKTV